MINRPFAAVAAALMLAALAVGAPPDPATRIAIVSPQWAAEHLGDQNLRVLDVRIDPHDYFAGHLPNAVNLADNTLRGPCEGIPAQYLPPADLAASLARAGVRSRDRVLVYSDGQDVLGATLVSYVLERLGHREVLILDGGWAAYRAAGLPTSQDYPGPIHGDVPVRDNASIRVSIDEVKARLGDPEITFIDVRPIEDYRGTTGTWVRNGHIPGAISIDWQMLMQDDNPHRFRSPQEIRSLYESRAVFRKDDIILYCGTGREATLHYVALKHMLGYPRVRVYEGSWKEYAAHRELPVETTPRRIASR